MLEDELPTHEDVSVLAVGHNESSSPISPPLPQRIARASQLCHLQLYLMSYSREIYSLKLVCCNDPSEPRAISPPRTIDALLRLLSLVSDTNCCLGANLRLEFQKNVAQASRLHSKDLRLTVSSFVGFMCLQKPSACLTIERQQYFHPIKA